MKSSAIRGQHSLMNSLVKPSGPGDLLFGRFDTTDSISSYLNGSSSEVKSYSGWINCSRSKSI